MPKVGFVTGGASGIGAETVRKLVSLGYVVAAFDRKLTDVQHCTEAYEGDVTKSQSLRDAIERFVAKHGKLDCLVCCAGVISRNLLVDTADEEIDRILDINVKGTLLSVKCAVPHMNKGSSIILMGSSSTHTPTKALSVYCASKGAIEAVTKSLALDLAPDIRVNAIAPGLTETPLWVTAGMTPEAFKQLTDLRGAQYPLQRVGVPQDSSAAIAFLISDDASWITGVHLEVDGGTHL